MDVSSAGTLARSLQALRTAVLDPAVMEVVQLLATKPMQVGSLQSPHEHCQYYTACNLDCEWAYTASLVLAQ